MRCRRCPEMHWSWLSKYVSLLYRDFANMNRSMCNALMEKMDHVIRQNSAMEQKIDEQRVLLEQSATQNYLHPIPRPRQGKEMNRSVNVAGYLRMEIETRNENVPVGGRKYLQFPATFDDDRANRDAIRTLEGLLSYHFPEEFGYRTWEQTYARKPRLSEKVVREASAHQDLKVFAQAAAQWAIRMLISSKMKTRKRSLGVQENAEDTEEDGAAITPNIAIAENPVATSTVPDLVIGGLQQTLGERIGNHAGALDATEQTLALNAVDNANMEVNGGSSGVTIVGSSRITNQNIGSIARNENRNEEQHLRASRNEARMQNGVTESDNATVIANSRRNIVRGGNTGGGSPRVGRGFGTSGAGTRGFGARGVGAKGVGARGVGARGVGARGVRTRGVLSRRVGIRGASTRRASIRGASANRGSSRGGSSRGESARGNSARRGRLTCDRGRGEAVGRENNAGVGTIARTIASADPSASNRNLQDVRATGKHITAQENQGGPSTRNETSVGENSTTTRKRSRVTRVGLSANKVMRRRSSNL